MENDGRNVADDGDNQRLGLVETLFALSGRNSGQLPRMAIRRSFGLMWEQN